MLSLFILGCLYCFSCCSAVTFQARININQLVIQQASARAEGILSPGLGSHRQAGQRDSLKKKTVENKIFPEPTGSSCPCFVSVLEQLIQTHFLIVCFHIRAQLYSSRELPYAIVKCHGSGY